MSEQQQYAMTERTIVIERELDVRPLRQLQHDWLDTFAPHWDASLQRLKRRVES